MDAVFSGAWDGSSGLRIASTAGNAGSSCFDPWMIRDSCSSSSGRWWKEQLIEWKRKETFMKKFLIFCFSFLAFLLVWVIFFFLKHPLLIDFYVHLSERQKIIEKIKTGEIKPDKDGLAKLSDKYRQFSCFGKVMVIKWKNEFQVFFESPTRKTNEYYPLIYSSGNDTPVLEEGESVNYDLINNKTSVEKGKPMLVHKFSEHWFYVEDFAEGDRTEIGERLKKLR